jgi:hypothetical protein
MIAWMNTVDHSISSQTKRSQREPRRYDRAGCCFTSRAGSETRRPRWTPTSLWAYPSARQIDAHAWRDGLSRRILFRLADQPDTPRRCATPLFLEGTQSTGPEVPSRKRGARQGGVCREWGESYYFFRRSITRTSISEVGSPATTDLHGRLYYCRTHETHGMAA